MAEQTLEEHIERHVALHASLDELLADFIVHTKKSISETSLWELIEWSRKQTIAPDV